jgi:hypothetical protein
LKKTSARVPIERVEKAIMFVRSEKVILDAELAKPYEVTTTGWNEQIERNGSTLPARVSF